MDRAELVVDAKPAPGDASDGSGPGLVKIVAPVAAGAAAAKLVSPLAGVATLVLAIGLVLVMRKPSEGRTVLRVDGADLEVRRERRAEPLARFPLVELLNVTLDRETRQTHGRAPTERVRLALVRAAPADPIFVPEERVTPIEAEEWHGRVRRFLRENGWVPGDER
ncbi:MAG TPA: hypothetical protein VIF62_03810 [Labilithrix sp.]|jgi:hypothetical protein